MSVGVRRTSELVYFLRLVYHEWQICAVQFIELGTRNLVDDKRWGSLRAKRTGKTVDLGHKQGAKAKISSFSQWADLR